MEKDNRQTTGAQDASAAFRADSLSWNGGHWLESHPVGQYSNTNNPIPLPSTQHPALCLAQGRSHHVCGIELMQNYIRQSLTCKELGIQDNGKHTYVSTSGTKSNVLSAIDTMMKNFVTINMAD